MKLADQVALIHRRYLVVIVVLAVLLMAVCVAYARQTQAIRNGCSATSAAAKLDLSGMVPLCRDYKETPR